MNPKYQPHYYWQNRGKNVHSTVARYYEPTSTAEIQQIVFDARQNHQKVRVIGDSHSWSPLGLTDDYLICTRRFNQILSISADPPQITVEPGVTIAATLQAFTENNVCLPMNVDIPTLTIGGAVAVGANGFSKQWGTYSEFIQEVELVTGTGEIRTINKDRDPRLWSAVACSLGLCGVFTKITLNLVPMFHVRVVNRSIDMPTALEELPALFTDHDYAQVFWFPFNRTVTVQTSDVTSEPPTWKRSHQIRKNINGWMETYATHLVHPLLLRFPQMTPLVDKLAARSMNVAPHIMTQCENMLLGNWINSMVPSLNASVSFPSSPDDANMREAWMIAVELVKQHAVAGHYPANLAMNMRLFGRSTALLHTIPAAKDALTCNIQITTFNTPHWEGFKQQLMAQWLQIPGSRPHWAKEYQGIPGIANILQTVYGESLQTFLQIRDEEQLDPENIFVNQFLHDLLF